MIPEGIILSLLWGQVSLLPLLAVWGVAVPLGFLLLARSRLAGLLLLVAAAAFWLGWGMRLGLQVWLMTTDLSQDLSPILSMLSGGHMVLSLCSAVALLGAVWSGRQSEASVD